MLPISAAVLIITSFLTDWAIGMTSAQNHRAAQLTPVAMTATAFYYYDTFILAKIAALLDKTEDAGRYEALAARNPRSFQP